MVGLRICAACGELAHPDLCRPALASILADQRVDHDEDRKRIVRLEVELADARQQLLDLRMAR